MHKRAVKRYQTRLDSSDPITTEDTRELVADIFDKLENEKKRGQKSSKANKVRLVVSSLRCSESSLIAV